MKRILLTALFLTTAAACAQEDRTWILESSTLTYHMSHPIHEVDGVSHAARGKGLCHASVCEFLVAAPVKSFDSGDSNRDLHMLQTTRGAQFPVVTVRFRIPQSSVDATTLDCDIDVEFAGQTVHYPHVTFQQTLEGSSHHIRGVVPATLSDFKIDPPSFLTVPIKNAIPVKVDTTWHGQ